MREKFLTNYGGLVFNDIDETPPIRMTVSPTKLQYVKRRGWHSVAEPPGDGTDDDKFDPFAILQMMF